MKKQSPDMIGVLAIYAPEGSYDDVFISNYTTINIVDGLSRVAGVGSTMIIGQRDYAMRVWLRPDKLAKLGLTASDIAGAIRDQNVQAPAGQTASRRRAADEAVHGRREGRLSEKEEYDNLIVQALPDGSLLRVATARTELAARTRSFGANGVASDSRHRVPGAGRQRPRCRPGIAEHGAGRASFPPGLDYSFTYSSASSLPLDRGSAEDAGGGDGAGHSGGLIFLGSFRATFIRCLRFRFRWGSVAAFIPLGFAINTRRCSASCGDRHCGGRRHRGGGGGGAPHSARETRWPRPRSDGRSGGPASGCAGTAAVFVPVAFMGGITGELYRQFAITLSVSVLPALVALT